MLILDWERSTILLPFCAYVCSARWFLHSWVVLLPPPPTQLSPFLMAVSSPNDPLGAWSVLQWKGEEWHLRKDRGPAVEAAFRGRDTGSHKATGSLHIAPVPISSGFPSYQMPHVSNFLRISGLSFAHGPEPWASCWVLWRVIFFLPLLVLRELFLLFTQFSTETQTALVVQTERTESQV